MTKRESVVIWRTSLRKCAWHVRCLQYRNFPGGNQWDLKTSHSGMWGLSILPWVFWWCVRNRYWQVPTSNGSGHLTTAQLSPNIEILPPGTIITFTKTPKHCGNKWLYHLHCQRSKPSLNNPLFNYFKYLKIFLTVLNSIFKFTYNVNILAIIRCRIFCLSGCYPKI